MFQVPEGFVRVRELMSASGIKNRIAGRVSISQSDLEKEVLGNIDQIKEVIRINRIKKVIFATSDMTAAQIIDNMHLISDLNIRIRIAAAGERYIIGSRYVNSHDGVIRISHPSIFKKIEGIFRKKSD